MKDFTVEEVKNRRYMELKAFLKDRGMWQEDMETTEIKAKIIEFLLDEIFEKKMAIIDGLNRNKRRRDTAIAIHGIYYGVWLRHHSDEASCREIFNLLRDNMKINMIVELVKKKELYKERIKYLLGQ